VPSDRSDGASVTLDAVAREAGVSAATASRVLNGNPRVGDEARRRVERAVVRLGYVPNAAARSLVTRRSDSVAVVIPEPTGQLFTDPYFPRLLRGISAELSAHALQLVLVMPQSDSEERRLERYLVAGHVDAAILVSLHGDDPLPAQLAAHLPVVVAGRPPGRADVSYVDVDNVEGARHAVEHLLAGGRRVVATIAGPADMPPGVDRLAGYRLALAGAGVGPAGDLEVAGPFSTEAGEAGMRHLLAARPDIDAVFAASDLIAVGALRALRAAGRRVPEDVALVGFDDSIADTTDPPLSSVRQPVEEMGRELVRLVLARLRQPSGPGRRVILATQLVPRLSSRGVPHDQT
jgi:DNA-binding LacI/PurR family transcriptional regulator